MKKETEFDGDLEMFLSSIRKVCTIETCHPGSRSEWSEENPLWGHCGAVAEIVREICGGTILTGGVILSDGTRLRHIWNLLPDGSEIDMTWEQFPEGTTLVGPIREKERITDTNTLRRANRLLLGTEFAVNPT